MHSGRETRIRIEVNRGAGEREQSHRAEKQTEMDETNATTTMQFKD